MAIRWVFPGSRGLLTPLGRDRIVLGRGDSCEIQLPGTETSRQHAEIRREGALYLLRDLDSRNGVFVNANAVKEAPLVPGQIVRLGEWIGVVTQATPEETERSPVFELLASGMAGGPVLRPVLEPLRRAAESTLPIVIVGETGTGKEGCAKAVHAWSGRRGPWVAVNCAALPVTMAEGELFGYRKGAFTGADRSHPGYFRAAHEGTLLLDELPDLPESLQAKLLRALEQQEVWPLGASAPVPIDVRVVAASQVSLGQAVAEGRFRPDLCARLEGLTLVLPPLRARKEEIPYLFSYLLTEHSGGRPPAVEPRLVEALCLYDWPFNVRELDLLVRRLLVLHAHEGLLKRSHLPEPLLRGAGQAPAAAAVSASPAVAPNTPLAHRLRRERELEALTLALRAHGGNVACAAAAAGISRQRAYRLMQGVLSDERAPSDDEMEQDGNR